MEGRIIEVLLYYNYFKEDNEQGHFAFGIPMNTYTYVLVNISPFTLDLDCCTSILVDCFLSLCPSVLNAGSSSRIARKSSKALLSTLILLLMASRKICVLFPSVRLTSRLVTSLFTSSEMRPFEKALSVRSPTPLFRTAFRSLYNA